MKEILSSLCFILVFSALSIGQAKEYNEYILCDNESDSIKVSVFINEKEIETLYESDLIQQEFTAFYLYINPETGTRLIKGKFFLYKEGTGIFSDGSVITKDLGLETTLTMSRSQNLNKNKADGFTITIKNLISTETLQCRYSFDE